MKTKPKNILQQFLLVDLIKGLLTGSLFFLMLLASPPFIH